MPEKYQHSPAYDLGDLKVSSIHTIHYEQFGKPDGKPVVYLHGGPGGSATIKATVFFDPAVYRVVIFDQRGCGKSTPSAEIRENTPVHLVEDIEALRTHLGIPKWHLVFGGSFGSLLGLLYAETHPAMVGSLILRSMCVMERYETDFIETATEALFPEFFEEMTVIIPEELRKESLVNAYGVMLHSNDEALALRAAKAWAKWQERVITIEETGEELDVSWVRVDMACMAVNYFVNDGWFEPGQLLKQENVDRIQHIPGTIIQGRWDVMCPPRTAYELHKKWPSSKLHLVPKVCHTFSEPGLFAKLIEACDEYGKLDLV